MYIYHINLIICLLYRLQKNTSVISKTKESFFGFWLNKEKKDLKAKIGIKLIESKYS